MFEMVALTIALPQCNRAPIVYRPWPRNIQSLPVAIFITREKLLCVQRRIGILSAGEICACASRFGGVAAFFPGTVAKPLLTDNWIEEEISIL
jgi:hypothetical protein